MPRNRIIISISIPPDLNTRLDEVARSTGKTKSRIIYEALSKYLTAGSEGMVESLSIKPSYQQPQSVKQNGKMLSHEKFW